MATSNKTTWVLVGAVSIGILLWTVLGAKKETTSFTGVSGLKYTVHSNSSESLLYSIQAQDPKTGQVVGDIKVTKDLRVLVNADSATATKFLTDIALAPQSFSPDTRVINAMNEAFIAAIKSTTSQKT
jgi:hypothetical protein